jgi:hypothetical protein
LGQDFLSKILETFQKRYLGEQPPGMAVMIKTKGTSAAKYFGAVCVVSLFRVLTPSGDTMAWLDPLSTNADWAYTGFRSALASVYRYKQSLAAGQRCDNVICPDMLAVRFL